MRTANGHSHIWKYLSSVFLSTSLLVRGVLASPQSNPVIKVQMYNLASVDPQVLTDAENRATRIFRATPSRQSRSVLARFSRGSLPLPHVEGLWRTRDAFELRRNRVPSVYPIGWQRSTNGSVPGSRDCRDAAAARPRRAAAPRRSGRIVFATCVWGLLIISAGRLR